MFCTSEHDATRSAHFTSPIETRRSLLMIGATTWSRKQENPSSPSQTSRDSVLSVHRNLRVPYLLSKSSSTL